MQRLLKAAMQEPVHTDLFDNQIKEGSVVITSIWQHNLEVCVVKNLTPKMVRVKPLTTKTATYLRYPKDLLIIEGEDVTSYILRNS